ncbi:MAG: DeoR/GlpR transcriptional regulator [Candidatus Latescibacteria bacterium]|jgi:DeoR/GlpR family transcriptional regulator of sugar metabolism|nr:DeoR/GlpR transcriptional regulator [Candidatus Latescibacterota bacterium]MBT4139007.1 DeoR/GlpR transcriptional regulator [Candidatus Latescibacterota bacterium]MBT5829602.1 DeoR/GlpR transcriptional regulator [Candidatus Latescibacterota bacterium]
MLALQRHRQTLDVLEQENSVRVTALAKQFQVTEETIRRDLEKLETDGKLVRSHGGAVRIENAHRDIPFLQRNITRIKEKTSIAKRALQEVSEADVIALDASTSAYQMARLLPDIAIHIITNSLPIITLLEKREHIKVIATGGLIDHNTQSLTGPLVDQALDTYHINKFFFSCRGVDFQRGLSEAWEENARYKQKLLALADQSYLLADTSKLDVRSKIFFAKINDVDIIFTDTDLNEDQLKQLQNTETIICPNT